MYYFYLLGGILPQSAIVILPWQVLAGKVVKVGKTQPGKSDCARCYCQVCLRCKPLMAMNRL